MTILYVIIGLLAVLAAKSIVDVRRLVARYAELQPRSASEKNPTQEP